MQVLDALKQRQAATELSTAKDTTSTLENALSAARAAAGKLEIDTFRPGQARRPQDTKRLNAARAVARDALAVLEQHEARVLQHRRAADKLAHTQMREKNRLPAGGKSIALPTPWDSDACLVPLRNACSAASNQAVDIRQRLAVARARSLVDPHALALGSEVYAADQAVKAAVQALDTRERELRATYVAQARPIHQRLTDRLAERLKQAATLNDNLAELCDTLGPIAPGGLPATPIEALGDGGEVDLWLRQARAGGCDV